MLRRFSAAALLLPNLGAAQEPPVGQTPLPTPTATPSPTPSPSPEVTPTPVTPAPTPTPRATSLVGVPTPTTVRPPSPTATPSPAPSAPAATPMRARRPGPIETVVLTTRRGAMPLWPWLAGVAGLLLLPFAWWSLRRVEPDESEAGPPSELTLDAPAPRPAELALALHPSRAGLNLISATADCEVTIVNEGDRPAEDVRADVQLFSAREERSDEIAAFFAAPIARPATPAFALQPGEERRFRIVTALPHESIHALDARGRPMFVPLVAVAARFRAEGEERRIGQTFVLGVERAEAAKLAPMWLDTPPRQYDNVAARPHGAVVRG